MANSVADSFLTALREGREFIPIHVGSLRLDTVTNFDLYLQAREGEPAVLYARQNVPFDEDARKRLEDNQVEFLYISADQQSSYRAYLETNLSSVLGDAHIGFTEKSEILYMSAHGLVKEILENPYMENGISRSKDLVQATVDFLLSQRQALRHLVLTASVDYFTYTHSINACVYGVALMQRLEEASPGVLEDFGLGVLLRDIGMSQIDSAIRDHDGKLSKQQFEILKQHPILGEQILREQGLVAPVGLQVVRKHHEKLDGSGYPDGLLGDEIPDHVRVATIADIFNALTTHRPYRKALNSFDAIKLMNEEMRTELDPDLFRPFIEMMGAPA